MSLLINLNFSPLASMISWSFLWWNYILWIGLCLLKSLLSTIQHIHCLLVFCMMSFLIHLNLSSLACIIFQSLFDEITLHEYFWFVIMPFNRILFHYTMLGVCWFSFLRKIVTRIHCNVVSNINCMEHYLVFLVCWISF